MFKRILCVFMVMITVFISTVIGTGAATVDKATVSQKVTTTIIIGDVDLDGVVSVMDATEIQRALIDLVFLEGINWEAANVFGDNSCDISNATMIQRYLAGYSYSADVGKTIEYTYIDNEYVYDIEYIEKAIEKRFMEYVNEERKAVGVQQLKTNDVLMKSSKIRSKELPVKFSHTRPDGTMCYTAIENINQFGWRGENIAMHGGLAEFNDPDTIEDDIDSTAWEFFDQFKKSTKGHYENMIKAEYNCHGAGVTIVFNEKDNMVECFCAHMFGETF